MIQNADLGQLGQLPSACQKRRCRNAGNFTACWVADLAGTRPIPRPPERIADQSLSENGDLLDGLRPNLHRPSHVAWVTALRAPGSQSDSVLPDPPNSEGKSLNFVRPSFIGSTVSP